MSQSTNGMALRRTGLLSAAAIAALAVFSAPVAQARGGHGAGGSRGFFGGHGISGGGHGPYGGGHGSYGRYVGGWHGGSRLGGGHYGWGWGGYYPYWGWPYYYSTWWGGPSYFGGYAPGGNAVVDTDADDGWSDRGPLTGGSRTDVRPESAPRASSLARLKLSVSPADAVVYLDDRYLGAADDLAAYPRGVVTEPGTHTISVARPGFRDKTIAVTARAGSPVDVVVDLER